MKYPFNVELCTEEFARTEGATDKEIRFFRIYIAILNDIYNEGLNKPVTGSNEDVFKIETCHEDACKECFKGNYEEFLKQARDAYKRGQEDRAKNTTDLLKQSVSSVG
jgi:hypothetical protein